MRGTALDSQQPVDSKNTSIRSLARDVPHEPFDELLRGNGSFGAFLEAEGYAAVPSPLNRGPGEGNIYFNGGYNTRRHGSLTGGSIDAIQIESANNPRQPQHRSDYVRALACAIKTYICVYYSDVTDSRQDVIESSSQYSRMLPACSTRFHACSKGNISYSADVYWHLVLLYVAKLFLASIF